MIKMNKSYLKQDESNDDRQRSKAKTILLAIGKFVLILASLYFFICSLSFLSDSFRLLGGKNIGGESYEIRLSSLLPSYVIVVLQPSSPTPSC